MAKRKKNNGTSSSLNKTFQNGSKMRRYKQIFDEDVSQMRTGFYSKDLYKQNSTVRSDDIIWTIEPGFEYRSDLISTKFYGTSKYSWIIEDLNDIKDPIKDLKIGLKLKMPSQSKILSMV